MELLVRQGDGFGSAYPGEPLPIKIEGNFPRELLHFAQVAPNVASAVAVGLRKDTRLPGSAERLQLKTRARDVRTGVVLERRRLREWPNSIFAINARQDRLVSHNRTATLILP